MRSRSVSRSRVVKINNDFASGESLDPSALLSDLLSNVKTLDVPLTVKISDGNKEVSYSLPVFMSKEYEVVDGVVKFGFQRLQVRSLHVNISFDLQVSD